ncbi:hypothetical protein D3C78_1659020 [compost metagenome]
MVPRFSVMVCRVNISRVSLPMNWPTSSTRNRTRCLAGLVSRYSRTQWQKFSTETLKVCSDSSNHLCAASADRANTCARAFSISS